MNKEKGNVVFILGSGRSGTTLLYKILSLHREVAYLSNYQNRYPKWHFLAYLQYILNQFPEFKRNSWFKEHGNAYFNEHRKWLHAVVPTPSEAEPVYASCNIPLRPADDYDLQPGVIQCLQDRFESIRRISRGRLLLTKRTDNNRRILIFRKIFPEAKYIHIIRDGRAVAYSLPRVAWWDDHVLPWANKTPNQMTAEGFSPLEIAAKSWVEVMKSLEIGIAQIPRDLLLEVRYEELLKHPRDQLRRLLDFMELTADEDEAFWGIVDSLHLAPKQEAWMHNWTESELNLVQNIQRDTLHQWGFKLKE